MDVYKVYMIVKKEGQISKESYLLGVFYNRSWAEFFLEKCNAEEKDKYHHFVLREEAE